MRVGVDSPVTVARDPTSGRLGTPGVIARHPRSGACRPRPGRRTPGRPRAGRSRRRCSNSKRDVSLVPVVVSYDIVIPSRSVPNTSSTPADDVDSTLTVALSGTTTSSKPIRWSARTLTGSPVTSQPTEVDHLCPIAIRNSAGSVGPGGRLFGPLADVAVPVRCQATTPPRRARGE